MKETWHNNRISRKLNEEYPRDFSICDIDGVIRTHYVDTNEELRTRLIIYESKNDNEQKMRAPQIKTLRLLEQSINWDNFDNYSGVFVIKIMDIEAHLKWYSLNRALVRETSLRQLYEIFSCKETENTEEPF